MKKNHRRLAKEHARAVGYLYQRSALPTSSNPWASARTLGNDARIGDIYITRTPVEGIAAEHLYRPALLWGLYRNLQGDIVAADFLYLSTQSKCEKYPFSNLKLFPTKDKCSYVKTSATLTLPTTTGFGLTSIGRQIERRPDLLLDLLVRRAFSITYYPALQSLRYPTLDLSGTVREGVWFPFLTPAHIRSGLSVPDVCSPEEPFTRAAIDLPHGLTPNTVDRIVRWADWYRRFYLQHGESWPASGTFPQGWTGWDKPERFRNVSLRDWVKYPDPPRVGVPKTPDLG